VGVPPLAGEVTEHLGHEKHRALEGGAGNIRNGTRPKTVLTDAAGKVEIAVPRDWAGTLEPVIVAKRQRRLTDVDAVAISLYAKGLTTGEISVHFAAVYGVSILKDTVSRITDAVVEWGSPRWRGRCRPGVPGHCCRCTRRSSSTRSMSRSPDRRTGRSVTSRATPRSGPTWAAWAATAMCSDCGPGKAAGRARSFG